MGFLDSKSYCEFCPLESDVKKKKLIRKSKRNEFKIKTDCDGKNVDVLILTDTIEQDNELYKLDLILRKHGIKNYVIAPAMSCRCQHYHVPEPMYTVYAYCKSLDIKKYNPKVIITLGKALYYFTKNATIPSWKYFNEPNFNPTWFLNGYSEKEKIRIYPSGFLHDILRVDTYEYFHLSKQFNHVKEYLNNYSPIEFPEVKITKINDFKLFCDTYKNKKHIAIDTETNSLDTFIDDFQIGCITMSFDGVEGFYIPFNIIDKDLLKEFLKDKFLIWANGKYDTKGFHRLGIKDITVDEDINLLFHLMNTERKSNRLKLLAWLVGFGDYDNELNRYVKRNKVKNYLDIPENILMNYATLDAIVTFRLWQYAKFHLVAKQPDIYNLYRNNVIAVIPVMRAMEIEGLLIDKLYHEEFHNELQKQKSLIEADIYTIAGEKFNIASNDDLGLILQKIGLKNYGQTKKGIYKTGEEILQKWKVDGYEIAEKLLEYRTISKLDNTFVGGEGEDIQPEEFLSAKSLVTTKSTSASGLYKYVMSDGRIHGTIMPAMTSSWRSLSFNPNLQNFVKKGDMGYKFRKIFIPPEDFIFCEADYSGFQLRIACLYSNDPVMKDIFINLSGDMHSITAINVFHRGMKLEDFLKVKGKKPYKQSRNKAKAVNFGFIFGKTAFSFKNDIEAEWTKDEIDEYIATNKLEIIIDSYTGNPDKLLTVSEDIRNKFFNTYPNLLPWMKKYQQFAEKNGYIESPFMKGGRRHLSELLKKSGKLSKDKKKHYSNLYNIAINSTVQTFEAIILYQALKNIYDDIKKFNLKSKIVATVHDSIVFYIHKDEIKKMYYIIKEGMETSEYDIPMECEIEMGNIWGFSKEVKEENLDDVYKEYNI